MSADRTGSWAGDALARIQAELPATPLRALAAASAGGVDVLVKDETALPTGSLKYRHLRALFAHAITTGHVGAGTHVVVATGGAVAVAGAYLAGLLGLPFTAVVPARTGPDVLDRIERHGGRWRRAELPPAAGQQEGAALADRLGGHFLDHFADADRAMAAGGPTLADEVFAETTPEWIVVGVGTGATSAAVGRYLRRHRLPTRLAVVDSESSAYFPAWVTGAPDYATGMPSRIPGIGRPRVEPGFQPDLIDLVIPVPDGASVAAMRWARDTAGLDACPATGANLWGARHLARRMRENGTNGSIVTINGDSGEAYRNTHLDAEWLRARGLDPTPFEAEAGDWG
ncbi:pyridoxal-phosphate dependent enzyme [Actinophytocola gossypii]|uniref:Pyridoxal-phosphate dependent enzyme n=1 Tax=Actinophytocola gossypii TaxID=2812003 RepID=A0ABT2J5T0_9PSEU|nr:pyridoxal-phosphate dependent enzyme [Actinophytocola gossypii]MCT2583212.1 pyridoxal-phosphate dependent enzyme [Actinophytocola gossypii]